MCSIGEDDFGDEGGEHAMQPQAPLEETDKVNVDVVCSKCGVELNDAIYKLSFRPPECRVCFLSYARHKFRAALGSSKILPRDAHVLLCIDGSSESVVLLDMLHFAQTENTYKRLHCNVCVLYLDESDLHKQQDQSQRVNELLKLQKKYVPFEFYKLSVCTAEEDVPDALRQLSAECVQLKPAEDFLHKLTSLRSLTARQDYLQQIRRRLMGLAAQQLACGYVFMPTISTNLATQLLTAVALGRGGSAALDVSLLDDRLVANVKLVRPLKDLNEAEVQLYIRAQKLQQFVSNDVVYGMELAANASLQNLTQAFITTLQQNYASTVSTVFRTGDKIAPNRELNESFAHLQLENSADDKDDDAFVTPGICVFCLSPLDCLDSQTLLATAFSSVVSEAGTTLDKCDTQLEERARSRLHARTDKCLRQLCHACRNIQTNFSNNDSHFSLV